AWSAFWAMTGVVIVQAIAISTMMPLKTIENSIVRVNDTTGETEVISNLKNMDETTEQVMSRYWLAKYLRH
ncbi:Type IV secretory pathway component, partial [Escherichia coli]